MLTENTRAGTDIDQNFASARLTGRQLEILQLLSDGDSAEQIALRLHISPETVRTHLKRAVDKLGARNRTHAIASALRVGAIN